MTSHQLAAVLLAAPNLEVKFYYDSGNDHLSIHQVIITKHSGLCRGYESDLPSVLLLEEAEAHMLKRFTQFDDANPVCLFREDAPES